MNKLRLHEEKIYVMIMWHLFMCKCPVSITETAKNMHVRNDKDNKFKV